jgi:hypothetical protein
MTEVQEEYSDFANSLQEAMASAAGRELSVAEEEVVEDAVEDVTEDEVDEAASDSAGEGVEESTEDKVEEQEFKLIPKEWTKKEQEVFQEALDNPDLKDAAEAFISRYESLREGFHKKAGERAEFAKKQSMWDEVFDDKAKEALRQRGINEPEYVKRLLNVERNLIANPAETIKRLMEAYKVDPQMVVSGSSDDDITDYDKTIAEMKKEIAGLKQGKQQTAEQAAVNEEAYIAKQVKDFEFAIDETGELKYPLFSSVKDEMGILLQKGKAKTLEEAYNMSPTVKSDKLEKKAELQSRQDIEDEKRKVAKAKKAARGITNRKTVKQTPIKMSFEDRFKEKLAEHRANS